MLGGKVAVQQFGMRRRKRHSHASDDQRGQNERKSLRYVDR